MDIDRLHNQASSQKKLPEKPLGGIQVFQFIVKYWSIDLLFNTGYVDIVTI